MMAEEDVENAPEELDPAVHGPVDLPDAAALSVRSDLQAAGAQGDEPYAPDAHVYDPADDLGLTTGQGNES